MPCHDSRQEGPKRSRQAGPKLWPKKVRAAANTARLKAVALNMAAGGPKAMWVQKAQANQNTAQPKAVALNLTQAGPKSRS